MKSDSLASQRTSLLVFTFARTILNTGFRLVYPFIATFARALGVEIEAIALAITARSALGLAGPLLGNLGDSVGRKAAMLLGLLLFTIGFAIVVFSPTYPSLFAALLLGAAGKIIFDPAMQAYLGDRVDYNQRSAAIAVTEVGWSGASLLGLPLVGWLIARQNWIAPFPVLALMMLTSIILLWRVLPSDVKPARKRATLGETWVTILSHPSAMAALSITLLISFGNETINIVYGLWLEGSFGLQVAALGAASSVIGIAELSGEGFVATFTDRMGKKRAIGFGLLCTAGACLALPILASTLIGVLLGLFLFYLSFEFTFVSLISLVTELMPSSRATLMAGNLAAAAGGRALGALSGSWLYSFGIFSNASVGALLTLVAVVVLWRWVKVE
jgi:predicted MFS family arabinose efflux permease